MSELYRTLKAQSDAKGESRDCTVRALAAATWSPYARAHKVLEDRGRKKGRGCHDDVWLPAIQDLGHTYGEVTRLAPAKAKTATTAVRWLESLPDMGYRRSFILSFSGHIACWKPGHGLVDWMDGTRRHRIQAIYIVHPLAR